MRKSYQIPPHAFHVSPIPFNRQRGCTLCGRALDDAIHQPSYAEQRRRERILTK